MSRAPARREFRLNGWHVLGMLLAFFGITAAVDAVMVANAYLTYPGEVSSTPYEDGLAFDSELGQQRAQARLGWRMTAGLGAHGDIEFTARDRAGAPLRLTRIQARLERPATEQGRRVVRFVQSGPGAWRGDAGALAGAWDLRLSAYDAAGRRFDAERRLIAR
jgi:nitrogen fixation protein FixH